MKRAGWVILFALALVFGGCTQTTKLERQVDSQEKTLREMTAKMADMSKALDQLRQQSEAQAKLNLMIQAKLDQMNKGVPNNAARDGGPMGMPGRDRMAEMRDRQVSQLADELKLTDEQKEKVKAIMSKAQDTMHKTVMELRESGQIDRDAMRTAMEKMRTDTTEEMKAILTPEQMEQYQKLQDRFARREDDHKGGDTNNAAGAQAK